MRARQEKKFAKDARPAQKKAPKKIGPIETALLVGIPIVFGLCISYLFSRAAASRDGAEGLGLGLDESRVRAGPKRS